MNEQRRPERSAAADAELDAPESYQVTPDDLAWLDELIDPDADDAPRADIPPMQRSWLIDAADLLAEPDPGPTPWLVEGLIVDQALVAAVGRWKTTKSYALLDLCISIATGRPAFGQLAVPAPGPVVFVNEESGRVALWRRLDALCRGRAIDPEELRTRLHVAANARVALDDAAWQNDLLDVGRAIRPRLIVFDPLARMKGSLRDENAQKDIAVVLEFLRLLRDESGAAVCFVHHVGHQGGNMRGSSDLESIWETRLTWKRDDGQASAVEITSEHREAETGEPIRYRIGWDGLTRSMRFDIVEEEGGDVVSTADRILHYIADHPREKNDEIAKGIGIRRDPVDRALAELVTAGLLETCRSGRLDKLGREIRDIAYRLHGGSSQTSLDDTPGTNHGTNHRGSSQPRTSQDEPHPETAQPCATVVRPDTRTNQDEPEHEHRGSVARPTPLGVDAPDEPPDDPLEPDLERLLTDHADIAAADTA